MSLGRRVKICGEFVNEKTSITQEVERELNEKAIILKGKKVKASRCYFLDGCWLKKKR